MDEILIKFKNKLLLPFPMKGVERKIYSCVILWFCLGIVWSLKENSWSYLDKSGSAIVAVGVWITFRDFANLTGKYIETKQKELNSLIKKYYAIAPKGLLSLDNNDNNDEIKEISNANNDLESLKNLFIKRLRITEATIIIIGTLLNSYGSVIFQLLFPLN